MFDSIYTFFETICKYIIAGWQNMLGNKDIGSAFQVMWQGMLSIFVVMAIISIVVYLFTKLSKK